MFLKRITIEVHIWKKNTLKLSVILKLYLVANVLSRLCETVSICINSLDHLYLEYFTLLVPYVCLLHALTIACVNLLTAITSRVATLISAASKDHVTIEYHVICLVFCMYSTLYSVQYGETLLS